MAVIEVAVVVRPVWAFARKAPAVAAVLKRGACCRVAVVSFAVVAQSAKVLRAARQAAAIIASGRSVVVHCLWISAASNAAAARARHYGTRTFRMIAVAVEVGNACVAVVAVMPVNALRLPSVFVTPTVIEQLDVLSDAVADTSDM